MTHSIGACAGERLMMVASPDATVRVRSDMRRAGWFRLEFPNGAYVVSVASDQYWACDLQVLIATHVDVPHPGRPQYMV